MILIVMLFLQLSIIATMSEKVFIRHVRIIKFETSLWAIVLIYALIFTSTSLFGQVKRPVKKKILQVSIVPSFGTNGLNPGNFNNYFSLNLVSGYSRSSLLFELGVASNLNLYRTQGLQIGGLINSTGGNLYQGMSDKERVDAINAGMVASLAGLQFSGIANMVFGDGSGAQISGGLNFVKGGMVGVQVSGLANVVHKYSLGAQISGLFNVSTLAVSGVQLSGLANYTKGDLAGIQAALLNHCRNIFGKNSYDNAQPTGLQLGLINIANKMSGFQLGLINYASRSQGTQIGLINIYKGGQQNETRDGAAIGLFNFGDIIYMSAHANEIFALNYEISTGTRQNKRIMLDKRNRYLTNALIFSHQSYSASRWGIGYGIKQMFFNRSEVPGMSESNFYGYGIDLQHINSEPGKFDKRLSLLTKLNIMAGKRILPKTSGINFFLALSWNTYITDGKIGLSTNFLNGSRRIDNLRVDYWPGLSIGLLLH